MMRYWIGAWFTLWFVPFVLAVVSLTAYAKSTFTTPAAALTADKSAFRWRTDRQGGGFVLDVLISDASVSPGARDSGERATRNIEITAAGKVLVDGVDTKIALPATFLQALKTFSASVDQVVDAVVKAGKIKL